MSTLIVCQYRAKKTRRPIEVRRWLLGGMSNNGVGFKALWEARQRLCLPSMLAHIVLPTPTKLRQSPGACVLLPVLNLRLSLNEDGPNLR